MKCLLDTHFLLWITLDEARLDEYPWLARYAPWGISPISFLEIRYLDEVGRLTADMDRFTAAVKQDDRFVIDDVPLMTLIQKALPLSWTRDPFDRLLAAHSVARRTPLCSVDRTVRSHHVWIPAELRL